MFDLVTHSRSVARARFQRRALISGGAAALLMSVPARMGEASVRFPLFLCEHKEVQPAFLGAFAAGLASGWMLEVLKNYGLIPGAQWGISSAVAQEHSREVSSKADQGFNVQPVYSGDYTDGQIAVSHGDRGDNYVAVASAAHPSPTGTRTCSLIHYGPDVFALHALGKALTNKGVPTHIMQSAAFPVHGSKYGSYDGYGHAAWREAMTANGGSVRWFAKETNGTPTAQAEVVSPGLKASVEYTA
jgi:hypothetical protein